MLAKGEACKNNSKTKLIREKDTDRLPTTTAAEPPVGGGGGGGGLGYCVAGQTESELR